MDYSGFYVDDSGVANWFDSAGNLVASQEPGGAIVFYSEDQAAAGSYPLSSSQLQQIATTATDWQSILTAVGGAISAWQLNEINLERARQGKPPINAAAYGPQVGVGLNADTKNLIIMLAVGAGALFLLSRKGG